MDEVIECLDDHRGGCRGAIEYRMPLSGTGRAFPRCDRHWGDRLDLEDQIRGRYPVLEPRSFDPLFAGERWDDDY